MNIWIGIPTGQRTQKAVNVVNAWLDEGVNVAVLSWDMHTIRALAQSPAYLMSSAVRKSFAVNQNRIIHELHQTSKTWDAYICGADDLWPGSNIRKIAQAARQYPESVLWVFDGIMRDICTHPIITHGWYEKHLQIFDERYEHCYCDTDLLMQLRLSNEVVKVNGISFDHRHPIKTKEPKDEIYRIGNESFGRDKARYQAKWQKEIESGIEKQSVKEIIV